MSSIVKMLLLGIGSAGVVGGPYILYLARFRPGIFPKPKLARTQGIIALLVGLILIAILIFINK
jgi:hypothetical protein